MKCLNMSWVSALLMCQEISMVMAAEAYEINKFKTGHPVYCGIFGLFNFSKPNGLKCGLEIPFQHLFFFSTSKYQCLKIEDSEKH